MRAPLALPCFLLSLAALSCRAPQTPEPARVQVQVQAQGPVWSTTPSGLGILDLAPGAGPSPTLGQNCTVEVLGWIEEKGEKAASSWIPASGASRPGSLWAWVA